MEKTVTAEASDNESAQLEAAFQQCLDEIERANERMKRRQANIEKLKVETRAILNELRAT